ncbi:hypothetical protein E2C01_058032 [Portunus trituberculatus]|uniref:Peptidase A2 domain-containing protein n=1 Tax=Portunus trituberculatus TaxID=210409 RepID=A0A5B7H4Z1_PORTR|nr:hypothetical protein [Portunus trituberculatus]
METDNVIPPSSSPAAAAQVQLLPFLVFDAPTWFCVLRCLQSQSIRAVIPNAEEMDEDDLQKLVDCLNDAQVAVHHHTNTMQSTMSPAAPPEDDGCTAINSNSASARQSLTRQQHNHQSCPRQQPRLRQPPGGATTFFLRDPINAFRFLVDTGAGRSLLPASQWRKPHLPPTDVRLTAVNGTPILTYGRQHLYIHIGNHKYWWNFVVANVSLPLLGADFLANYQLLVDVSRARLLDAVSLAATPIAAAPDDLTFHVIDPTDAFAHLRDSYPDIFKPELCQHPQVPVRHGIYHHIKTSGPPVFSRFRRLSPDKLIAAKQTFAELERLGICQRRQVPGHHCST